MLKLKVLLIGILITCAFSYSTKIMAQPTWTIDPFGKEKKPEKYEEKRLASEKTGEKKFKGVRKFLQNNTSHYNFYFNANNRINLVIERAKLSNKDDYSKMLSFYPYSLENTASQKSDLDSVIYKSTAGILLHDLRSEWVDNFYLLIGKSYFLKKDFDSAALTFQFINYNLFPRKKKDNDYNKIVGSNEGVTGSGSVSIANREKRNIIQRAFTQPASRNDALIWQIRTFTEQKEFGDAAGLISILQNDKNLPGRLKNDLEEVTSYWFFVQNNFDSSAVHLQKALSNADTKDDRSRWQYLLAEMYELTGQFDEASKYYFRAARQTSDPVMDIYARLSEAKMLRNTGNFKELDNTISNLLQMAKKDKYEPFRDIIYYSTGQLSLQKPDTLNSIVYYNKSVSYNNTESGYKDKSFFQLANIAFKQQRYKDAYAYYDSLGTAINKKSAEDSSLIEERKELLSRLVPKLMEIEREDSLQMLAALPAAERDALIKKMVKKYRKQNGLKEEDEFTGNTLITFADRNKEPVDLFKAAAANTGDWYFYNSSLRSKGFSEFKSKWGKRTNADNWRRKTALDANVNNSGNGLTSLDPNASDVENKKINTETVLKSVDFSFEGLMAELPLSKEKLDSSNVVIAANLYEAAQIFQNELQDYGQAIALYEDFIKRFPAGIKIPDVYFGLFFCYSKIGNTVKATLFSNLLKTNFSGSDATKVLLNPSLLKKGEKNPEVTSRYESVYNMFIEGNFEKAINAKKKADSTYGNNYWSPQLLYIESVYLIKERNDSAAILVLKNIESLYPTSALKPKATTLINVLQRRSEIEKYLTDLQVTRVNDDQVVIADNKPQVVVNAPAKPADVKKITPVIVKSTMSDTIKTPSIYINKSFTLSPEKPHYVAMILDKVDAVYVNEAKNAFVRFNKESMTTINVTILRDTIDAARSLLLFQPFTNATEALKYFDRIKKAATSEVSWLQPAKYSFIIISNDNLLLLKTNKDLSSYKQLLNTNFGNKF